jgi:hypothetical protein
MKTTFSLNPEVTEQGDMVLRTGKSFEIGNWPDKAFSLNEEEADDAIAHFEKASLNIEHAPSILDGLLGNVSRVWREGKEIMAEWSIPKSLHELLKGQPIKVSTEWETNTAGKKRLTGCALVTQPRIRDAVMMTAFSMSEDAALKEQILETMLTEFARPKKEKPTTLHASMAIQEAHDHAARHGALCSDGDAKMSSTSHESVDFTMKHEQKSLQAIHDSAVTGGATCPSSNLTYYTDTTQENPMTEDEKKPSLWDRFRAFFASEGIDVPTEITPPVTEDPITPPVATEEEVTQTAEFQANQTEIARLTAELAAAQSQALTAIAESKVISDAVATKFSLDNEAAIGLLLASEKIDFKDKAQNLSDRAVAPDVYDRMMARLPAKFSDTKKPTDGTVDAADVLKDAQKNEMNTASFAATANALSLEGMSPNL